MFPINVPAKTRAIICSIILATSSIASPRPFQVFAIYCIVFLFPQIINLIRKTEEGKLLVIITVVAMLCGAGIVMFPLFGLGSQQVIKAINIEQQIEAYHVDENRGNDPLSLTDKLLSIQQRDDCLGSSTILYCSSQYLDPMTKLSRCVRQLAKQNLIIYQLLL